jgi:filamentous hemagglutinin family protein
MVKSARGRAVAEQAERTWEFQLSREGRLRRLALLSALGICSFAPLAAHAAGAAPVFGTPAWFAQKTAQQPVNPSAPSAGVPSAVTTPDQAKTQVKQSMTDLANALAAIAAAQKAQTKAASQINVGTTNPSVPDGLVPGGLVPVVNPTDWQGASTPQKDGSNSNQVDVVQNQQKAILTWSSFNVGKNTTLYFDQTKGTQTDGSNNWVALNRVMGDVSGAQILGTIKAQGDVYIIDQNGIMFGAGSQVNTHSLIATSLSLFNTNPDPTAANNLFSSSGISAGITNNNTSVAGLLTLDPGKAAGKIIIEQGASITTGELGYSLIAAPVIENQGSITATDGQVILAAGRGVGLSAPADSYGRLSPFLANFDASDPGLLINTGVVQAARGNVTLLGMDIRQDGIVDVTTSVTRPGSITITADIPGVDREGAVTFGGIGSNGDLSPLTAVLPSEDGETTTSSAAAGKQFQAGSVAISGGSVVFQNGALLEAPGAAVSVTATTDGSNYQASADKTLASQAGRVFIDSGATIDVAGIANVELPVSDTMVTIGPLTANDLADSPLLRDGFLFTQTVIVDSTLSGTRADGTPWQGSPIIDAGGYIQAVPRSIDQMLVNGGSITLAGNQVITKQNSRLDLDGGYINYQGGMVSGPTELLGADGHVYSIGNANPNVQYVGFAGQYSADHARWNRTDTWTDPLLSGSVMHYEPGFVQGGNAGTLNVVVNSAGAGSGQGTAILDGNISAQAMAGRNQVASGSVPMGGTFNIGVTAQEQVSYGPSYFITSQNLSLPDGDGFNANTSLEEAFPTLTSLSATQVPVSADPNAGGYNLLDWTPINGTALSKAGFSSINITAQQGQIVVARDAGLTAKPGSAVDSNGILHGSGISLNAAQVAIYGDLTAHAGTITVTTGGVAEGPTFDGNPAAGVSPPSNDITVGPKAVLDASGNWVNDTGLSPDQISGSEFINGGTIKLVTEQSSVSVQNANGLGSQTVDLTGAIHVSGILNVSSGGYVQPDGSVLTSGGVPQGKAGTIALDAYDSSAHIFSYFQSAPFAPTSQATSGVVDIAQATLLGYGLSDGGTLDIRAPGFLIGETAKTPAGMPGWDTYLSADFFAGQGNAKGFGSYSLNAEYDAVIAPGTHIDVTQQNLLPNYAAIVLAPTGTNIVDAAGLTQAGSLDAYHRPATDLTITAGDYLQFNNGVLNDALSGRAPKYGITGVVQLSAGSDITADAGANIVLGSVNQVIVDGQITAHGGSITLDGRSGSSHGLSQVDSVPAQSVQLGADAVLDVSGVALTNPYVQPVSVNGQIGLPTTGKVLAGGTVSIYGAIVAAQAGSVIDVSGAGSGGQRIVFDLPQSNGAYATQQVWSDAGQVVLGAGKSLSFDGTIRAQAGSGVLADGTVASGEGGSLSLIALNSANAVMLSSDPNVADPAAAPGTLYFNVGKLKSGGVSSLSVGTDALPDGGAPETNGNVAPLTLGFIADSSGVFNLSLDKSFTADATNYVALANGATSVQALASSATQVSISAPYVALNGYYNTSQNGSMPAAQAGPSTLQINAGDFIDLGGAFEISNFNTVSFNSGGDIRFVTPESFDFVANSSTPQRGALYTAAQNLNFTARELYAASNNSFVIDDNAGADTQGNALAPTTITIAQARNANGQVVAPVVPLSAGGSLLFDAASIEQGGTVWQPAGSIVLGLGSTGDAATAALFNPTDPSLKKQINALPLVDTGTVTLSAGSKTSVSLDGAVIPYGTTVDGKEWQYNVSTFGTQTLADLTAPPAKLIEIQGAKVALGQGAEVDLSGGGELEAIEWVPGTGGTRDVLSQYNTSYASGASGTQVPLYPDARGIYALVPSYDAAVAAYDAVYLHGQASTGLGQAVYLSGAPGIPAGTYVLMPAKYATLPGAFRVIQDTGTVDSLAGYNTVTPDGTALVAGYYVNALDGSRSARTTTFEIQSAAVWGQYSDYTRTAADSFFPTLAAQAGSVTPQLPRDAGQLILGASNSLGLGASLDTAASAAGGAKAEIDIASGKIAVVAQQDQSGPDEGAANGVLNLTVDELNALQAGSLLLGGTRTQSSKGVSINALSTSLVVDDQGNALRAPELILVTQGSSDGSLRVASGSIIQASGSATGSGGAPITVNGDGALLMVSQNQPAPLTRANLPASGSAGTLSIDSGARIDGGNSLILDASGNTLVDPSAQFSAANITADSGSIVFVNGNTAPAGASGLIIGDQTLQQFAGASRISLRSYGNIDFEGAVNVTVKDTLALSAGGFTDGAYGNAGDVALNGKTLILSNDLDTGAKAPGGRTPGTANLQLNAGEIDFGTAASGSSNIAWFSGFGAVNAVASGGIVGQSNAFDFGAVPVTLKAPVIMAGANANASIATTGVLTLASAPGTALSGTSALGGQLKLSGGSIEDSGNLHASGGNLILDATSGDLHLASGALINVAGVGKQFYDIYQYAPGGIINLTAEQGQVRVDSGATLDFSGAQPAQASGGGSDAGSLIVSASMQNATIAGSLKGGAAPGYSGGSFSLDAGGAEVLGELAAALQGSGVTRLVAIRTGSGDLELPGNDSITAGTVTLVADAGTVRIDAGATINANGAGSGTTEAAGGTIALYGTHGVDIEGALRAHTDNPNQRGGTVQIGTSGTPDGTLNGQYGYENVDPGASGAITIGSGANIDVSGGSAGGHGGGTVDLRAPLLSNGDVNVAIAGGASIKTGSIAGAATSSPGSVMLEAYAVWSTDDQSSDPGKHFDGIIDPAGWYSADANGNPVLVAGTFTDQNGNVVANGNVNDDFFTPTSPNTAHQSFYGSTLVNFAEGSGFSSALQNRVASAAASGISLTVAPGIELDNPDSRINGGNITVASNWNLGTCNPCTGNAVFLYRYQSHAPVLTIRAANNLDINASISDGFSQLVAGPNLTYSAAAYSAAAALYSGSLAALYNSTILVNGAQYSLAADPGYQAFTLADPSQAAAYYNNYSTYVRQGVNTWTSVASKLQKTTYTVSPSNVAAGAPNLASYSSYADYALAYSSQYLNKLTIAGGTPQPPARPSDPNQYGAYIALWQKYETTMVTLDGIRFGNPATVKYYIYPPLAPSASTTPVLADVGDGNAVANVATLDNVAPLAYATLAGGNSTSYRLVAGADLGSADPLSVVPASSLASGGGSVAFGGYTKAADEQYSFANGTNPVLVFPTTVRTGTGSIEIAAAGDFTLNPTASQDPGANAAAIAPGVVYTGGAPAGGVQNGSVSILRPGQGSSTTSVAASILPELIVIGAVNPVDAGDISLSAGGDIVGAEDVVDTSGSRTGTPGQFIGQFWTAWMETGNAFQTIDNSATMVASSINFGAFDQGVLSAGGNVGVSAGGSISNLAVSLPTTWALTGNNTAYQTYGGGNLNVAAGGDILSGDYFVAQGQGTIKAGGQIGADAGTIIAYTLPIGTKVTSSATTLLALQDAQLQVNARQGANIGGVYDPSYLQYGNTTFDSQPYSTTSSLSVTSTAGDIAFDTLSNAAGLFSQLSTTADNSNTGSIVLPASLNLTALSGAISVQDNGILSPSSDGGLNLIAAQSIALFHGDFAGGGGASFGLIDASPAGMPSPLDPLTLIANAQGRAVPYGMDLASASSGLSYSEHQQILDQNGNAEPLHAGDNNPVRIYSLEGSILDGQLLSNGFYADTMTIAPDKVALLYAGQDIVNLDFRGQNLRDADVTRIVAGHDIYDTPLENAFDSNAIPGHAHTPVSLQQAGPGYFDVEAGRDIGPLTNQNEVVAQGYSANITGIDTVGNLYNPYLPHQSAAINLLFGIAPGIDTQDFIARYIAPGASVTGVPSYTGTLISFMEQYDAGAAQSWDTGLLRDQNKVSLTADQAWTQFQALPGYVQQLFVEQVFSNILYLTGQDYHNTASPYYRQYARGYDAINTLFPYSYGYTANNLTGGTNGSNAPMSTGDLDVRGSTIQTQQGGDITILGPGGQILLASASAPPYLVDSSGKTLAGPNTEGILTLQQGNIDIFTDRSVLLAQSRIFTEQGGNLLIWSSNGDINAGEGTKTTAFVPPLSYVCDLNDYCIVNPAGEVTGAGIATLQTVAGAPPGDVELVAPRGTVDFGSAGVRVSGNLVVAAQSVANAFNVQVKGTSVGVPTAAHVDTGALSAASSATAAAEQASALTNRNSGDAGSQITVEVVGFGTPDEEQKKRLRQHQKKGGAT